MVRRRRKVLGRYTDEQLAAAIAAIRDGASNPEIMRLLDLATAGSLKCVWRAYGFPMRTPEQVLALQQRSGEARRERERCNPSMPPMIIEPFTVKAVGYAGSACVACESPTAPNGYCVNCGVNNARKRVA